MLRRIKGFSGYLFPLLISLMITFLVSSSFLLEQVQQRKKLQRETLKVEAASVAHWLDDNFSRINLALINLQGYGKHCSEDDLFAIRSALFELPQITEIGYVDLHGQLSCTSWQEVSPPIQVAKAPRQFGLRFLGPIIVEFMRQPAIVLARTLPDRGEVNALLRLSWLKDQIRNRTSPLGYMAIVDSDTGVPVSISGQYTLPVGKGSLFPVDSPTSVEGKFDNKRDQFITLHPLLTVPQLSVVISEETSTLYRDIYDFPLSFYLSIPSLFLIVFLASVSFQKYLVHPSHQLKRAIRNKEFINYYQPLVTSDRHEIVGVEVLMRWHHPVEGVKSPATFIPQADQSGLIKRMTAEQIERSANDLKPFIENYPNFLVNINISMSHLLDSACVDQFIEMKKVISGLVLEVTEEKVLEHSSEIVQAALEKLAAANIQIAIDDFGTGYCGLNYLRELPVSILKADKSFIAAMGTDAVNADVLDMIIQLSKKLGLITIAEGVETEEQATALLKLGVDIQQGWLHAYPMPIKDLLFSYMKR